LSVGADDFYFLLSTLVVGEWPEKGGARTMEIGPIRNQNLIFWPLAKCLVKIDEGQQKIKIVRTNLPINFLPLPAPP